jgi:tetratricopeptide (TPR) repeat protein
MESSYQQLVDKGFKSLRKGDSLVAMIHFENAFRINPSPAVKSGLAYCLARERQQFQKAQQLCQQAAAEEPGNPDHYYQLGRIYLLANKRKSAILAFRKGLKQKRHQPIIDELHRLGIRNPPVFSSLARDHFLNRSVGKLLAKIDNH